MGRLIAGTKSEEVDTLNLFLLDVLSCPENDLPTSKPGRITSVSERIIVPTTQ